MANGRFRPRWARWGPVVAWAAVIFAFSAVPDLSTGLGTWDLVLRKLAHLAEYAILGALLYRAAGGRRGMAPLGLGFALRGLGRVPPGFRRRPGRLAARLGSSTPLGSPPVWLLYARGRSMSGTVTIDLDRELGDTRPLWDAGFSWTRPGGSRRSRRSTRRRSRRTGARRRRSSTRGRPPASATGYRALERFAEDHAPVYLRPDPRGERRAAPPGRRRARGWSSSRTRPEPLARVAVAHLGLAPLDRRARDRGRSARAARQPTSPIVRTPGRARRHSARARLTHMERERDAGPTVRGGAGAARPDRRRAGAAQPASRERAKASS